MRGPFLPLLFFLALFLKPTSPSSHSTSSGSSLIICGVDGSVYTLSAWDGSLMGKFMSGSAVVSSSTMSERLREQQEANGDVNSGKDGGANVGTRSQSRSGSKSLQSHQPTIVPGLDGLIYTLSASGSLDLLSVSAMDIVDTPLATCTPSPSVDPITGEVTDGNTEECGMLMGEKRSRVFALDVAKGTVRWVQYVGERDKGFTTTESKVYAESQGEGDGGDLFQSDEAKNTRNPVLLQRDDYIIRQVSIHSGDEAWNLTVSHFSALDFDFDSGASDVMGGGQEGESEQGRSMAIAGGLGWEGGQRVFPRMSGRREDDDTLALFPKIVWGSSGSSLSAYDPVTMDLLWSKEIESTVTTMYGVDDNNHWVPLTFLTEEDVNKGGGRGSGEDNNGDINNEKNDSNDDNNYGHPSTIVPFDNAHNSVIQYQRQGLQSLLGASRLGRVLTEGGSTLFITPVRDTAIVPHALGNRDGGVVIVDVDDDMIGLNDLVCTSENESDDSCPSGGTGADHFPTTSPITQQPTHHHSHSSQEGLFLTWQFLLLSLVFILFVAVFLGRMAYTELKQRWLKKLINTPKLLKEITADEKQTSKHDHNPPEMRLGTPDLRSRNGSAQDKTLHSRSASMPALSLDKSTGSGEDDETIGSRSLNGAGINGEKPSSTLTSTSASTILKEVQNVNLELRGDRNRNPSASASPSPPPPPQPAAETIQTPTARELPSEIDGIPLVLYPRYSREFTEKSALGRGGFGAVYRCSNIVDGREYAIKKIRIDTSVLIGDDDSLITTNKSLSTKLKKVLREVKILALLDHPNIVRYYTAWLERDEEATTPVGGSDKHYDGSRKAQFDSTLDPMMEEITTDASLNNSFSLPTAHKNGGNNVTFTDGTDCGEKSDLGFNWEPNTNSINPNDISTWSENSSNEEGAYVDMSSGGNKKGSIIDGESQRTMRVANNKDTTDDSGDEGERPRTPRLLQRHILYIQMRYCRCVSFLKSLSLSMLFFSFLIAMLCYAMLTPEFPKIPEFLNILKSAVRRHCETFYLLPINANIEDKPAVAILQALTNGRTATIRLISPMHWNYLVR